MNFIYTLLNGKTLSNRQKKTRKKHGDSKQLDIWRNLKCMLNQIIIFNVHLNGIISREILYLATAMRVSIYFK